MAVIKLSTTHKANRLISYALNRSDLSSGISCLPDCAMDQFTTTRNLFGKNNGIQAHHLIQSFAPGEVSPAVAHSIGISLAKKVAPNHEVLVVTHTDKEHIHNHLVINSVNFESGKKLHLHGVNEILKIRAYSDELCNEQNLSVIQKPSSKIRYTLAEKALLEKGLISWKDELRQAIDLEKSNSSSYLEFKKNLQDNYQIEVNDSKKHITFKHPDANKVVRGQKLGLDYERSTLENGFNRQTEPRRIATQGTTEQGITNPITRDQRTQPAHEELYSSPDGQRYLHEPQQPKGNSSDSADQHRLPEPNEFDFQRARKSLKDSTKQNAEHDEKLSESASTTAAEKQRGIGESESRDHQQHPTSNYPNESGDWELEQ